MTADWWDAPPTPPTAPKADASASDYSRTSDAPVSLPTIAQEPDRVERKSTSSSRIKASTVAIGLTGGLIAAVLIIQSISVGNGGDEAVPAQGSAESRQGPSSAENRPSTRNPVTDTATVNNRSDDPLTASRNVVTLTATPSGKGRAGTVMKISIRNNTDKPVTVMNSIIKGDGKSSIVGLGTLAPNKSRTVQPNEEVEGTVEFATDTPPQQVALCDLWGNVVAVSAGN